MEEITEKGKKPEPLIPSVLYLSKKNIHDYSLIRSLLALTIDFTEFERYRNGDLTAGIKGVIKTNGLLFYLERWLSSLSNLIELISELKIDIVISSAFEVEGYRIGDNLDELMKQTDLSFITSLKPIRNKYTHPIINLNQFILKHSLLLFYCLDYEKKGRIVQKIIVSQVYKYLKDIHGEKLIFPKETLRIILGDNYGAY